MQRSRVLPPLLHPGLDKPQHAERSIHATGHRLELNVKLRPGAADSPRHRGRKGVTEEGSTEGLF